MSQLIYYGFLVLISFTALIPVKAQRISTSTSSPSTTTEIIPTNCNSFYRNLRRSGSNLYGQFTVPVDSDCAKMQLQVKFNRPVSGFSLKQTKARDINGRREFSINSMEPENGKMIINSIVRVRRSLLNFRRVPQVTRIVYNGKTLCAASGEAIISIDDESTVIIDRPITTKKNPSNKLQSTATKDKTTNNNSIMVEDDEDELDTLFKD